MKLLFVLIMFPLSSFSQKIKSEIDKFTNEKRVETLGWIQLRPTMSAPLAIRLRSVGQSFFITLAGSNIGANVIGNTSTAIFLLDDKTTITTTSTGIQDYEIDLKLGNSFKHQYSIKIEDLKKFSQHLILSVRKSDSDTYHDFDILNDKNSKKFREAVIAFLKEVEKP